MSDYLNMFRINLEAYFGYFSTVHRSCSSLHSLFTLKKYLKIDSQS